MSDITDSGGTDAAGPPTQVPGGTAFLLIATGRQLRDRVDVALTAHGLTYRHLSALGHLSRNPGLSYSDLARRAGITVQSMQATLSQLLERKAVEHINLPGRGRRAQLRLTPVGVELLDAGTNTIAAIEDQLLTDLAANQRTFLRLALLKMIKMMKSESEGNELT